jgi:hypothetical protein
MEALTGLAVPGRPIRSVAAEDRSAAGTATGRGRRTFAGPCSVRTRRRANHGQRARVVTGRSLKPQVAASTAL